MSGTPSAVADPDPIEVRMSLRTTPLSVSTSGPLVPSPGYGPAVSSGMTSQATSAVPAVAAALAAAEALAVGAPVAPVAPHAARPRLSAPRPRPASTVRRATSVSRSNASPWSQGGSSGSWSGRPS